MVSDSLHETITASFVIAAMANNDISKHVDPQAERHRFVKSSAVPRPKRSAKCNGKEPHGACGTANAVNNSALVNLGRYDHLLNVQSPTS